MDMALLTTCAIELAAAAVIDARTRTYPNALALLTFMTCALYAGSSLGTEVLVAHAVITLIAVLALLGFELGWRAVRRAPGIGMGDLKLLFAVGLISPAAAIGSLAIGLLLLAVCGIATDKPSLPLLPFMVPAYLVLFLVLH